MTMTAPDNEPAHEILPRLWLGNKFAAANTDWLREHDIQTVFNCTKTLPFDPSIRIRFRVPVDDNLEPVEIQNMALWAAETQIKLLRAYRGGHGILVHCHAGMQRSAAVVAMFLITTQGKTADEAMAFIRNKRAVAFFPSANFERAIREWDMAMRSARASMPPATAPPSA